MMRCVLFCTLEAIQGELCLLGVLEVAEVVRCVLRCILEAVEGGLCLLEVMRRLYAGGAGGDALHATLHTRGCGGWTLFCWRHRR